ncbi:MAG: prepilin-type N-terminal cleavage/methylation domain-containing protein [Planctomycetota bacterium]|jgi:prepilin-type N-terminal cleavage/methylation domain-containing protein
MGGKEGIGFDTIWYDTGMQKIYHEKNGLPVAGFTLFEMLVVIAVIAILSGLLVAGVGRGRSDAIDEGTLGELNTILLALEDYQSVCGWYPQKLTVDADTNGHCQNQFGNFVPDSYTDEFMEKFLYMSLAHISINPTFCGEFHIAVELSPDSLYFDRDDDAVSPAGFMKWDRCQGQLNPNNGIIDGSIDANLMLYDIRSSKSIDCPLCSN